MASRPVKSPAFSSSRSFAIGSTSDDAWNAEYPFDPDDATLGDRIGGLLGSDEGGGFTHASAHLDDLRVYVDATTR